MPVVLAVAIGTFLVDLLGPMLRLPDWVGGLALTTHLGEPMVGAWDIAGVVACLVLAIGGLVVGAWGMNRRDVGVMTEPEAMTERRDDARRWLLLIYRIKAESSGRRTYVWRQLRQLGAVYLQQAVAVLPDRPELRLELDRLGQRIRAAGGEASLLETVSPSPGLGGRTWSPASMRPATPSTRRSSTASSASRTRSGARPARSASGSPSSRRARRTGRSSSAGSPA